MTARRIPVAPRPPAPPALPAPPTEDTRPVRRLWWPQRQFYVSGVREVPVRNSYTMAPTKTKSVPVYDKQWYWPGQRVRVSTVRMQVDGGLLNLFVPFALFMALAQPTEEVEVYELVAKDGEPK